MSGCINGEDSFQFIEPYQDHIETALGHSDIIEVTGPKLQVLCGQSYGGLVNLVGNMTGLLTNLKEQTMHTLDLVACEKVGPVISSAVNEGVCKFSVVGFAWTFICK